LKVEKAKRKFSYFLRDCVKRIGFFQGLAGFSLFFLWYICMCGRLTCLILQSTWKPEWACDLEGKKIEAGGRAIGYMVNLVQVKEVAWM